MHATVTDKYIHSSCRIDIHPFMVRPEIVVFSKKVHHIIGSMCMWSDKVLYLLSVEGWATLVRKFRFNYCQFIILNHRYNKAPAKVFSLFITKGTVTLFFDAQTRMISAFRASCHCSNRAQNRELLKIARFFVLRLSEDILDNLNER